MRHLGSWFAAAVLAAWAVALTAGPMLVPAGPRRPVGRPQMAATATAGPHPPEHPMDPGWTPPDGVWVSAVIFDEMTADHPINLEA